jgi:transcriptional regulator with XRE-family HTH domain
MNIGERIKRRRIELDMTQEELAKKVGYKSRSSINKIELSRDLPLPKVEEVAKVLDCTPAYLMGWETDLIIDVAQKDVALSNMDDKVKEYALKISNLDKAKQEAIFALIDTYDNKED